VNDVKNLPDWYLGNEENENTEENADDGVGKITFETSGGI
jgi:hypothetical protein